MKKRIISAIVLILIVALPIYLGEQFFAFLVGIAALLGFKELLDLKKTHHKIPFWMCALAILSLMLIVFSNFNGGSLTQGITYKALLFTIFSLLIPIIIYKNDKYTAQDAFFLIGSVLFLGLGFSSFILARARSGGRGEMGLFIYLILIPMITDTFAYILGTLIGKHKMAPIISPHKSWEGFACGLIAGTIIPSLFYLIALDDFSWKIIILTAILSLVGQVGDLVFSKIKRENDIKDYSKLIPGHGGILDRLDSMIFIFMTFIFLSSILY